MNKKEITNNIANIKYYISKIREEANKEKLEIDNYEDIQNIKVTVDIFDDLCNNILLNIDSLKTKVVNKPVDSNLHHMCTMCLARIEGKACFGVEQNKNCLRSGGPIYKQDEEVPF